MKQFKNKVLHIKNEETFENVKQLIFYYRFRIAKSAKLHYDKADYLYFNIYKKDFNFSYKNSTDQEITLEQFKELLKQK